MLVNFFCGTLNIRTGQVDYSNGGLNLRYLHRDGASSFQFVRMRTDGSEYQRHEGKNLLVMKKRLR